MIKRIVNGTEDIDVVFHFWGGLEREKHINAGILLKRKWIKSFLLKTLSIKL